MMADCITAQGLKVRLTNILDASNKRITDLPMIPEYVANRRLFVCGVHILGRCTFAKCQLKSGHVPHNAIPDAFAEEVVTMLTPGVNLCTWAREQEGLPGKRLKAEGKT